MTLRETLTGKMANRGFAVEPGEWIDRITFVGMGNGKRATVLLPAEEPENIDEAADRLVSDALAQIAAL